MGKKLKLCQFPFEVAMANDENDERRKIKNRGEKN